ncbi:MAG: adenine nucleotide alpha hydrolase family protein [Desulfurococcales archaeon]|nr:adenine nucleotide alpha hydrolase family protein [Desulfurococcales archaeon]
MIGRCRVCGNRGYVFVPWTNTWFCREHYIQYFNKKIRRVLEKYVPLNQHKRVLIAVSGGKDSISMLYASKPVFEEYGIETRVLFIDLGIKEYSELAKSIVREHSKNLGLNLVTIELKEYGFTIDDIGRLVSKGELKRPVCSICGMVKRYLYNKAALETGSDLIATGHSIDDSIGFSMIAISQSSLLELSKQRPYLPRIGDLVARVKPLFYTYEKEAKWYIDALGLKILEATCPYKPLRKNLILDIRSLFDKLDSMHPGYKISFTHGISDYIAPIIDKAIEKPGLVKCSICGQPSTSDPCGFCRLRRKILKPI